MVVFFFFLYPANNTPNYLFPRIFDRDEKPGLLYARTYNTTSKYGFKVPRLILNRSALREKNE